MNNILSPSLPSASAAPTTPCKRIAAKEGLENVKWIVHTTSTAHSFLKSIFTILIIYFPLLSVTQNFISLSKLLELKEISTFIRVVLDGGFTVSLLEIVLGSVLGNSQDLIVLSVIALLGRPAEHLLLRFLRIKTGWRRIVSVWKGRSRIVESLLLNGVAGWTVQIC
nr:hypothetical protein Iba_scaffold20689CG0010 [Ipomoea batatas]